MLNNKFSGQQYIELITTTENNRISGFKYYDVVEKVYLIYKIYMHLRSYDQDIQIVYVKQSNRTINKFCIHGNEVNFKIKLTVRILYLNR